jgi:hypothetical protein
MSPKVIQIKYLLRRNPLGCPKRGRERTRHVSTRVSDFTPAVDLTLTGGTGPVRYQRPSYVTLTPPCSAACPAGEDIRGWLARFRPATTGGRGRSWLPTIRCPRCTAGSAITPARPIVTAARSMRRSASMRSSAIWATRRAPKAGLSTDSPCHRQACADRGRGAFGPVGGLSPGPPRPCGGNPRGRAGRRRHDAFRHSRLSAAARRTRRRGGADRGVGGDHHARPQGHRPDGRTGRGRL